MSEVTETLVGAEVIEGLSEEGPEAFDGSRRLAADQPFEFREDQLNRVRGGAVRWQINQCGSDGRDRYTDASDLVCGEVGHRHKIASTQSRCELLLDVGQPLSRRVNQPMFTTKQHCATEFARDHNALGFISSRPETLLRV